MSTFKSFPQNVQDVVDLRSDTVTRPTAEMYEAMLNAPLGDDVLGDDPTVMRLEDLAADMTGKEEAVFVPSGTMGNQMAIATHCGPGDALIAEEEAHILYYECGGPAVFAHALTWTVPSTRGVMDPADVEKRILKRSLHTPGTALLCIENTHNRAGGTIVPLEHLAEYRRICDRHGIKLHLDGARMFNAAAALRVPVSEVARPFDTVNFCLSKGLRAPVGSVLCGSADFIARARVWRKRMGGAMRQAGILAACGIVSLTKMVDRLEEDHRRARALAASLSEMPGLKIDWETVQTNMVAVEVPTPASEWVERLREEKVWCLATGPKRIRLVLHADIDDAKLEQAVEAFQTVTAVSSRS
jgi:threonine aldolase